MPLLLVTYKKSNVYIYFSLNNEYSRNLENVNELNYTYKFIENI